MKEGHFDKTPFGKEIENNLMESFRIAGVAIQASPELDNNHKIDFVMILKDQKVGIQFSLKQDNIKARVAKICALDVVPRFIYLRVAKEFFAKPDRENGKDLYLALNRIAEKYSDNALFVNIDHRGLKIQAI